MCTIKRTWHRQRLKNCINRNLSDAYMYDENFIQEKSNITDSAMNWNSLLIKRALHINFKKPILNSSSKLSKERQFI